MITKWCLRRSCLPSPLQPSQGLTVSSYLPKQKTLGPLAASRMNGWGTRCQGGTLHEAPSFPSNCLCPRNRVAIGNEGYGKREVFSTY